MPNAERMRILKERYNVLIAEVTIKRWIAQLSNRNMVTKSKDDQLIWKTQYNDGQPMRCTVSEGDQEYQRYRKKQDELKAQEVDENGIISKRAWNKIHKTLWNEYGCCYYACRRLTFNALVTEDIEELYELVSEISHEEPQEEEIFRKNPEKEDKVNPAIYFKTQVFVREDEFVF